MKQTVSYLLLVLALAGCGQSSSSGYGSYGNDPYNFDQHAIQFLDHTDANATWDGDFSSLEFTTREGQKLPLKDISPGKPMVLVMTRGYAGSICPYCSTQVSRLIANYQEFEKRDTQVVVVYPLKSADETTKAEEFVTRAFASWPANAKREAPFPLVLDLELKAVDALGIRKDLSKPATYILDTHGRLQFAYVGNTLADRPSVTAILEQLDKINQQAERS